MASIGKLIKKTLRTRPSDSKNKEGAEDRGWLVVGLGNPGPEYKNNRHNIGFMAIDKIAEDQRFPSYKNKFQGELAEYTVYGGKVILLKPLTFMNLSGQSVGAAAKRVAPEPAQRRPAADAAAR